MQVIIGGDKDYRDWHESTSIPEIDIRLIKRKK